MERILRSTSAVDLPALSLLPGQQCWIIYLNALVLDIGGNLIDAISIATRAALLRTELPKTDILHSEEGEAEVKLSDSETVPLPAQNVPVCITMAKIGNYYVADPTLEEEACSDAKLTAAASVTGSIAMQKSGFGALDPMLLVDILQSARKVAASLLPALDNALAREQRLPPSQRGSFLT
eukprot:TRINITY_DN3360_c0_g1_i2.p1 TRINITY_DN3360_c0_g1~~TRINITY_DN3360_c0_g1_i2.p1  ORF type:complete len:180 (+),score=34.80 TRINITY_DN3360_c0_g1_i2:488-1027(+)